MSQKLSIAVIGAGGVGGYYGGRLDRSGHEVTYVARGAHAEAMRSRGLTVKALDGTFHLDSPRVVEKVTDLGPQDVVLICTKMGGLEELAGELPGTLKDNTAVIPLQNGVESEEIVTQALGPDHVLGGIARVSAHIDEPGVIGHHVNWSSLEFGELDNRKTERVLRFQEACEAAGFKAEVPEDIKAAIWRKFLGLAASAGVSCYFRLPQDQALAEPGGLDLYCGMIEETFALAQAKGIALDRRWAELMVDKARAGEGVAVKPSMLVDLERGKPMELEWLNGAAVRIGQALGVPTPNHAQVYEKLKPFAQGSAAA